MDQNNSLMNIGDLSKAATVLIEKICEAVGEIFKPWQIERVAKAEAKAQVILSTADIKVQKAHIRALRRLIQEETRKQLNIENITAKAIPQLSATANPENVDNDWIMHFFDKCKIISDEEMQKLWAKILAGEANAPGSYSKRTIEVISLMSKKEANTFESLCKFSWKIGLNHPLIFDCRDTIYKEEGIDFPSLTHLDNIGLITFNSLSGFIKKGLPKIIKIAYFGKDVKLEFKEEKDNELPTGQILLSQTGNELMSVCNVQSKEGFIDYTIEKWVKDGIVVNKL